MIRSFACDDTARLFRREKVRAFPPDIQRTALRKLAQLHAVTELLQLRVPPGNRLEALKGDRKGQHSIRINDQWRICFLWESDGPHEVEIPAMKKHAPIHPGEVLQEDFLAPLGLSEYRLAQDIGVPPRRINEIVKGKRSITADTALRLSRYFAWPAEVWLNLQSSYDRQLAEDAMRPVLDRIKPCALAAAA
ncbi:MAG: HigA family addiction module antidote protein [Verrucomicrobiaceae bacterium]|nr:HigA family addiction module antidote protein [Verrucomicrobiaceae bacterium]